MSKAMRLHRLTLVLLGLLLVSAATGCSKRSEEERVQEVVRKALAAANEKKVSEVLEDAAPGFKGPGGADVSECRRILLGWFMQQGWIHGFERALSVEVQGETAKAALEVLIARGNEVKAIEDVVPTNASVVLFHLDLGKIDGDWKLTAARYEMKSGAK